VARQPSKEPVDDAELDEVEDDEVEDDELEDDELEDDDVEAASSQRSADADAMWEELKISPVEIALPKGVGYTLRAYRLSTELTPTEVEQEEDAFERVDEEPEEIEIPDSEVFSEEYAEVAERERPGVTRKRKAGSSDESADESDDVSDDIDAELEESESGDVEDTDEESEADDEADEADDEEAEEEEAAEEPEPEEVPAFLGHRGQLFLFRSPEALVAFVKSDAEHDLTQLDTWESLKSRISVASVVPTDEDRYELDLVVENLRGGRDAWDSDLLISAGEVARDLAHALRLEAVRTALAPGSPLDDLDEALRAEANGGVGGFFARRRLKKIGAQQAALGWRTIIGKISAAVDWRD
jgi:hypothetical protein